MLRLLRAAAAIAAALTLATCGTTTPVPQRIATDADLAAGPVPVPRGGALVGAWVRPESLTQAGRFAAVRDFEQRLNRRLDIVNTYRRLHEEIGTVSDRQFRDAGATLMLSWTGAESAQVLTGQHDEVIRERARQVRDLGAPVLLRLRWEMDRPNLVVEVGSPQEFIAAWRRTRELFAAEGATNAAWVWCPTVEGFASGRAPAYYPGDDQVDWTCVDAYAGTTLTPMADLLKPFLRWAAPHPKPIMIGEYGVSRAWTPTQRATWLTEAAAVFAANPQIRATLYFESDPDDRQPTGQFSLRHDPLPLTALRQSLSR
ncbi:glycoside hydrolase family 26 protein [Catellatospora tritici]|uniref:glycoside hydrolase family 26 protein n=1 Tax=Catellatospora tritici TaxID=2851566 RepID=UPI001C2CEB00|nr:endoglucanase [Catellatospora tritici]MBV1849666.1 endoglucanase [Catellatospora tritici]